MVDRSEIGSEHEGTNRKYPDGESSIGRPNEKGKKTCADCGTTKTPLWRGGPAGPKSLCNACGIRSRKRRRAIVGLNKGQTDKKKARKCNNKKLGDGLNQRLRDLGRDVMMQRSKTVEKQQMKLGKEEQAAVLLMALSSGFFYA